MSEDPSRYPPGVHVDRDKRSDWVKFIGAIVGFTLLGILFGVIDTARRADQASIVQVAPALIGTPPLGVPPNTNPVP